VNGLWLGVPLGAAWLFISQSPQRLVAYAGACYAVAIVAALLLVLVTKPPVGCFRLILVFLLYPLLLVSTSFGSYCVGAALIQLAGWHIGAQGVYLLELLLYAVAFSAIYFAIARRARVYE
jgi:hypothetical protein